MSRKALLFSIATLLVGCASLPPPAGDPARVWQEREQKLAPLTGWELHGRLALRTDSEGWHASLVWVRSGDRHNIDLTGPLGRGHLRLKRSREGAELKDSESNVLYADSAEDLLLRATGYRVPLEGLDYWVRGLPTPGATLERELDPWGRLRGLRQDGWDIEFLEYARQGDYELPSKLFLRRELASRGERDGEVEVRLVIERWQVR
jgi:outer membrane lipoprotein LolB